jgi:hypothetical protein
MWLELPAAGSGAVCGFAWAAGGGSWCDAGVGAGSGSHCAAVASRDQAASRLWALKWMFAPRRSLASGAMWQACKTDGRQLPLAHSYCLHALCQSSENMYAAPVAPRTKFDEFDWSLSVEPFGSRQRLACDLLTSFAPLAQSPKSLVSRSHLCAQLSLNDRGSIHRATSQ